MSLKDKIQIINRNKISDSRGWFLKVINGKEDKLPNYTGEVYLISAHPGESRANHFHPKAHEWFTLVNGRAQMYIEDIQTKEKLLLELDGDNPQTVYVPNNIAHSFVNNSDLPYILVAYANELYDPADTVGYKI